MSRAKVKMKKAKTLPHKEFKARALARPEVKAEYDQLEEEFAFLDEILKVRTATGLTQAQIVERDYPIC
jgi:hypothetical protein